MSTLYKLADFVFTLWALGIGFGLLDVPNSRVIAVVAIWAMSEVMAVAAWKSEMMAIVNGKLRVRVKKVTFDDET